MKKIILYGGAFDPVHNSHLRIAKEAADKLNADVIFIPTAKPRWKEAPSSNKDRLEMLKIALKEYSDPRFSISDIEMKRENDKETYTIDTIKEFEKMFPNAMLCLLIGGDQVALFDKWKEPDSIKEKAKIYFVEREGYDIHQGNVNRFNMLPLSDIKVSKVSSSSIRTLSYIDTPIGVLDYISEHSLYYVDKMKAYLSEKRLKHSLSVARLSYQIAISNHLENPGRAYIAGALHDIGKEISNDEAEKMLEGLDKYPKWAYHQFIGAYIAENEFFVKDKEILAAIREHCLGAANMSTLSKIIYAADKIDPSRGWDSAKYVKLCMDDIVFGFLSVLRANYEFLKAKCGGNEEGISASKECFSYYLGGTENGLHQKSKHRD